MLITLGVIHPLDGKPKPDDYTYDPADETVAADCFSNAEFYDADLVNGEHSMWMVWQSDRGC